MIPGGIRLLFYGSIVSLGVLIAVIAFSYSFVEIKTKEAVYDVSTVPHRKVGLLLGCIRYLSNGRENLFFSYRIRKAVELFEAGKIDYILVSGDNSRKDYDESSELKNALMERGIPEERIELDYAGFSTLDSVVRASRVFGQDEFTVISQDFHVRRAVVIGSARGLDVVAVAARDVPGAGGTKTRLREVAARVKMMVDLFVIHRSPKFLGEPVHIGKDEPFAQRDPVRL